MLITGCQAGDAILNTSDKLALIDPPAVEEKMENQDEHLNDEAQEEYSDYEDEFDPWTLDNLLGDQADSLNDEQKNNVLSQIELINDIEAVNFYDERLDALYEKLSETVESYGITLEYDNNTEGAYYEPWTLEGFLGFEYDKLNEEQLKQAQNKLDLINQLEEVYEDQEAILSAYGEMYELLGSFGFKVPLQDFAALIEESPEAFTQVQKDDLLKLDEEYMDLYEKNPESDRLIEIDEAIEKILTDAGLDPMEVYDRIQSGAVQYAKYKYDGKQLTFEGDQSKERKEDLEKYSFLAERAVKVLSPDMKTYVANIIVNSDGVANILAYVSQENDQLTKWRIVLDIKDAFDEEGKYIQEYDETIVHEFAHLLTLNASQMQDESNGTYENEEGILAKESFLNKFYNEFWTDIYEDFKTIVDPNDENTAYDFYDKYKDQFVSDYAATNPEEDIAETFRIFVFNEKPEGTDIKDQKVQWMFEQEGLIKLRDYIRKNLEL